MSTKEPLDDAKLWGTAKLAKGTGRLWLDALGHFGIAFGAALLVVPVAYFADWGAFQCTWAGALVGLMAMLVREGIQWAVSGSPHLRDRLLDLAPALPGGAVGGIASWALVSLF